MIDLHRDLIYSVLILIILLSSLNSIIASSTAIKTLDHNTVLEDDEGMAIVANARGEYGLYWEWWPWPPGFRAKPQLAAESINVFMYWGDVFGWIYEDETVNKDVYKLYSYNWIVNHPNNPTVDLKLSILDFIEEHSYHWKFIILIGHSSCNSWEAYYWDHDHYTYYTTNMLLPDNNIWTPDYTDRSVYIYASEVRNWLEDKDWKHLPHIAFVIGCNSASMYDDHGGWAWAFKLSEEDYDDDLWFLRGFVGFDGLIYYNWLNGDYPAAQMIMMMIEYMTYDHYSSIAAFTRAAEETGFQYKIITYPENGNYGSKGGGEDDTKAVYIGYYAWQDPSNEEIALTTALNFLKTYASKLYSLISNKNVQPTISIKDSSLWISKLANAEIYNIYWAIPASELFNETYYDIVFEIDMSVVVKNGIGNVYSVFIGGSIKESPEKEIDLERIKKLRNSIRDYLGDIQQNMNIYLNYILNNPPNGLSYRLVLNESNNFHYRIIVDNVNAPLYVRIDNRLVPLTIKAVFQKDVIIVENPVVLITDYIDSINALDKPLISSEQALSRVREEFKEISNAETINNISLIVLLDPYIHEARMYYYGSYKLNEQIYLVIVDAYTGRVSIYRGSLAAINNYLDTLSNSYIVPIIITILIGAMVVTIMTLLYRRRRK